MHRSFEAVIMRRSLSFVLTSALGDREDDRLRQRASRRQGGADTEPNSAAGRGDRLRCEGKNDSEIG